MSTEHEAKLLFGQCIRHDGLRAYMDQDGHWDAEYFEKNDGYDAQMGYDYAEYHKLSHCYDEQYGAHYIGFEVEGETFNEQMKYVMDDVNLKRISCLTRDKASGFMACINTY